MRITRGIYHTLRTKYGEKIWMIADHETEVGVDFGGPGILQLNVIAAFETKLVVALERG